MRSRFGRVVVAGPIESLGMPTVPLPACATAVAEVATLNLQLMSGDSTSSGVGKHWQTQLVFAVNFLKQHHQPIRLDELAIRSSVEGLLTNAQLLAQFKAHERVEVDPKTLLYSYKPDFKLKSKTDLVSLLLRYAPRGGLMVKPLRESWPQVGQAIDELEKEGRVLVTRTGGTTEKEGIMKAVFLDEIGHDSNVDEEFRTLWSSLKTPIKDELAGELIRAGLNASNSSSANGANTKKKPLKKPKVHSRKLKITNVHLKDVDLTKDYVHTKK